MKAYRKEEVDNLFNSWQNDLDQLDVIDAIAVPDNATNGDMIKAVFPNVEFKKDHEFTVWGFINGGDNVVKYDIDWWNAPYKGVKE